MDHPQDAVDLVLAEYLSQREANPSTPVDATLLRIPVGRQEEFRSLLETVAMFECELPLGRPFRAVLARRYDLLRRLGEGTVGDVWLANDRSHDRTVSVQLLPPGAVPGWPDDGVREARVLATLDHRAVVRVLDAGVDDGWGYLVTEFVPASTLAQVVRALRGLDAPPTGYDLARVLDGLRGTGGLDLETRASYFPCIARLFAEIAHALQAAHELGVVHRALRPDNLLLRPGGRPAIREFGLRAPESGSARYAAPEQLRSGRAAGRARVDVYRLGALFYEALTLRPAFPDGAGPGRIPDPRRAVPDVPRQVGDVCLKAMYPTPDGRYPTMRELAQDLDRVAAGDMPRASRGRFGPFSPLRMHLLLSRHRVPLGIAAATSILLSTVALLGPMRHLGPPEPGPQPAVVGSSGVRVTLDRPSILHALAIAGDRVAPARLSVAGPNAAAEGSHGLRLAPGEHRLVHRTVLADVERLVVLVVPDPKDPRAHLDPVLVALERAQLTGGQPGLSLAAARGVIDGLRARDGAVLPWTADHLLGRQPWQGPGRREEYRLRR